MDVSAIVSNIFDHTVAYPSFQNIYGYTPAWLMFTRMIIFSPLHVMIKTILEVEDL